MHEPNVASLLAQFASDDVVLDVGGWACPFNRANYVIDAEPYETRGYYASIGGMPSQGGDREYFTSETWIQRDLCERTPFPFDDGEIDFVICSHVLEDVRDPLWVCSEMMRVAKRGYIEVPSRVAESCRGWESQRIAGLSHHRWLIDIDQSPQISFLMKYHLIHSHWRLSLPAAHLRRLSESDKIQSLFWEGSFQYGEVTIHGLENQGAELARFVQTVRPYPSWRLNMSRGAAWCRALGSRVLGRLRRSLLSSATR